LDETGKLFEEEVNMPYFVPIVFLVGAVFNAIKFVESYDAHQKQHTYVLAKQCVTHVIGFVWDLAFTLITVLFM
jgi:hypothetical protein